MPTSSDIDNLSDQATKLVEFPAGVRKVSGSHDSDQRSADVYTVGQRGDGVGPTAQLDPAQHSGVECLQLLTQRRKESQPRTVGESDQGRRLLHKMGSSTLCWNR